MSAAELTANGGTISPDIAKRVDEAINQVLEAQQRVAKLQVEICIGGVLPEPGDKLEMNTFQLWHMLETIDDRLHEALSKLGN